MNEITSQMNSELADNPFKGLADTAISSIQLQWGWALLVIGSILIITSSKLKNENEFLTENKSEDEAIPEILVCPKCKKEFNIKINYCTDCGEQLEKKCSSCSSLISFNSNYCANCGLQIL